MTNRSDPTTSTDRRRHERQAAPPTYLLVDGLPALLADWSFGGLGVRMQGGSAGLSLGTAVAVTVLRQDGVTWSPLLAMVRRIDADGRHIGIELENTEAATPVLMELFHQRLSEVRLPD